MIQPEAYLIAEYPRCKLSKKYLKEKQSDQDIQTKRNGKQLFPLPRFPLTPPLSNGYRNAKNLFSSIPHSMLDDIKPKKISRISIMAKLALELTFKMTNYPSHVDKQRLSQSCSMSYRQIETWFQNRRDRGPGAKQQSNILPQIDSLEQLRQTFQQLLLLGSTRKKIIAYESVDLPQLEAEDFQSSISESDSGSGDDTPGSRELSNFTYENTNSSQSVVENLSTQNSENEATSSDEESDYIHSLTPQSNTTFLKPYQKPQPETVSKLFSFPAPQWIRQRRTKPCPKSIPRATFDINSMSVDFESLHVNENGPTSRGTGVAVTTPEINSSESRRNSSTHGFLRKVAPLPRRHALQNTVTAQQSSIDEPHPRSVSSSSASSEDGGLSDHSSSSSSVAKDESTCTMSGQNLFRSRNVIRRNGAMHGLSRRKPR